MSNWLSVRDLREQLTAFEERGMGNLPVEFGAIGDEAPGCLVTGARVHYDDPCDTLSGRGLITVRLS